MLVYKCVCVHMYINRLLTYMNIWLYGNCNIVCNEGTTPYWAGKIMIMYITKCLPYLTCQLIPVGPKWETLKKEGLALQFRAKMVPGGRDEGVA